MHQVAPRGLLARARAGVASLAQPAKLGWVLAGLMTMVAGAFAYLAFASPSSGSQATSNTLAPVSPPSTGRSQLARTHAAVGQVSSVSPSGFALTTASGETLQVQLGPTTLYGTPTHPQAQAQIQVGSRVRVVGHRSGSTLVARRVVVLPLSSAPPAQPPPSPPSSA